MSNLTRLPLVERAADAFFLSLNRSLKDVYFSPPSLTAMTAVVGIVIVAAPAMALTWLKRQFFKEALLPPSDPDLAIDQQLSVERREKLVELFRAERGREAIDKLVKLEIEKRPEFFKEKYDNEFLELLKTGSSVANIGNPVAIRDLVLETIPSADFISRNYQFVQEQRSSWKNYCASFFKGYSDAGYPTVDGKPRNRFL